MSHRLTSFSRIAILTLAGVALAHCDGVDSASGFQKDLMEGSAAALVTSTNQVRNPSFESQSFGWTFLVRGGAAATQTQDETQFQSGWSSERVDVSTATPGANWNVQLQQSNLVLTANQPVTVSFWAKATAARPVSLALQKSVSPYTVYVSKNFALTTGWAQYSFAYTPSSTDSTTLLAINLGDSSGSVWLDGVSVSGGAAAGSGTLPPALDSSWSQVFGDEFSGAALDSNKWLNNYQTYAGQCTADVGALSCYVPEAISFSNGQAVLQSAHTPAPYNHAYTGAMLNTNTKFLFRFGYVDVRAKLPKGAGLWPAIWLLNVNRGSNDLSEIDIMELLGRDTTRVYQTFHDATGGQSQYISNSTDWSADFHNYGLKWEPGVLTYFIDDVQVGQVTSGVPDENMFLMINLDVGSSTNWGGAPDANTVFPAQVVVDYARIYQK